MQLPVNSHTNLSDYEVCPKRYYHKHVAKDCPVEEKSADQLAGIAVHEALKKRVRLHEPLLNTDVVFKDSKKTLTVNYAKYEHICDYLVKQPQMKYTELKLGMTIDGKPCDFFADNVWLRGVADLVLSGPAHVAMLLDWKNGKKREEPTELKRQALLLQCQRPDLTRITGMYYWLQDNEVGQLYDLSDTDNTWRSVQQLRARIAVRFERNEWPADEGPLCAYCPVSKAQCEFKRERK